MSKRLKIGFVLDDSLDKTDGVQQYVLILGNWLSEMGHEIHYIVGETKRRDIKNIHSFSKNVNVRFNRNRLSIPLPAPKREVERLVLAEDFDILHVQLPHSPMLAGRVMAAAPPTTTILGTFHILPYSDWHRRANRVFALFMRRSFNRLNGVISVSEAAQRFAKNTYDIDSTVIPNTIEVLRFRGVRPFLQKDQKKHIVYLGRLVERKGPHYLLKAAKDLLAAGEKDFIIDICGKGEMETELKTYVRDNGLIGNVMFHGFISEDEKPRYLAGADIAIFPSLGGECFGIVLIEAMAAGSKVVLGGNNPGYACVMRNQQLFDPKNSQMLAKMIRYYLHNSQAISEASAWQRQAIKQYDISIVGNKVLDYYDHALHKRGIVR